MKNKLYKAALLLIIIIMLNNCKKETSEDPYSYRLVEINKKAIEVYTINNTVENHHYTVENIVSNDWLNKNTINEINFNSSSCASFKFNESELKWAFDYLYSDLSVSYKGDSILFYGIKLGLNNENDTISAKGVNYNNTIQLLGVFFALNKTMPQGVEYGVFDKNKIFELGTGTSDTLALFHFTLTYEKNEK